MTVDTDDAVLKVERVALMMSSAELKAIDDYRFAQRLGSRAEAIRRLCAQSLDASGPRPATDPADGGGGPSDAPFRWVVKEHGGLYAYSGTHIVGFVTAAKANGRFSWVLAASNPSKPDPGCMGETDTRAEGRAALRRAWLDWIGERGLRENG